MLLKFSGTGSAFTVGDGNYQSNMVLEDSQGNKLLIDCGTDARIALSEIGIKHSDIDAIYISHLHADHVGGLEWIAFTRKHGHDTNKKPSLYIHEKLAEPLWNHTLSGGLSSSNDSSISIESYFDLKAIKGSAFTWKGHKFNIFPAPHTTTGCYQMSSYGLNFIDEGKNILITTDIRFEPVIMKELYAGADLIFQDCEISEKPSGVHAHYEQLRTLSKEIKGKMWLYHYQSGPLPDAKKDGFKGFVKKGQVFELSS